MSHRLTSNKLQCSTKFVLLVLVQSRDQNASRTFIFRENDTTENDCKSIIDFFGSSIFLDIHTPLCFQNRCMFWRLEISYVRLHCHPHHPEMPYIFLNAFKGM